MCYGCEKRLTNRPTNEMEQQSQRKKKRDEERGGINGQIQANRH